MRLSRFLVALSVSTSTLVAAAIPAAVTAVPPSARAGDQAVIRIDPTPPAGTPLITGAGYDLKQATKRGKPEKALGFTPDAGRALFGTGAGVAPFNVVRIPILASAAHRRSGVAKIDDAAYAPFLTALGNIPELGPKVDVYASLMLVKGGNNNEFPAWVKGKKSKQLRAGPYGQLLFDYVRWWAQHGVTIDTLGPLNEMHISAAKSHQITRSFDRQLRKWNKRHQTDLTSPKFIAPDSKDPNPAWFDGVSAAQWKSIDLVGVHYYSKTRDALRGKLKKMATRANGRPFWDTEFHWNEDDCPAGKKCGKWNEYLTSVKGFLAAADDFDNRVVSQTWWSYHDVCAEELSWCDPGVRAAMQSAVVHSTSGARALKRPADGDGNGAVRGKLTTRAFRRGDTVLLWVINDTAKAYDKSVKVKGWDIKGAYADHPPASYQTWSKGANGSVTPAVGGAPKVKAGKDVVKLSIPAHSLTVLTLPMS